MQRTRSHMLGSLALALGIVATGMAMFACSDDESESPAGNGGGAGAGGSQGGSSSGGANTGGSGGETGGAHTGGSSTGGGSTGGSSTGGSGVGGSSEGGTGGGPGTGGGAGSVAMDECASPDAAWLFCSGFEEADWHSVWDDYDGNPEPFNSVVAEPGPSANASNHVMRLRATPGERSGADLVKVVAPHDRLYARWYVAYEPGFNFNAPNHGAGLFAGDRNYLGQSGIRPSGNDFFIATLDYSRDDDLYPHAYRSYVYYPGMYQDCVDPNGTCWGDSLPCVYDTGGVFCTEPQDLPTVTPPQLTAGVWYCIELMIDAGTPSSSAAGANGGLDFWVDGVEQASSQRHHWMRTDASVQPSILWLSLFHHDGTHSDEGVMYDNVVVSTERIGCQ